MVRPFSINNCEPSNNHDAKWQCRKIWNTFQNPGQSDKCSLKNWSRYKLEQRKKSCLAAGMVFYVGYWTQMYWLSCAKFCFFPQSVANLPQRIACPEHAPCRWSRLWNTKITELIRRYWNEFKNRLIWSVFHFRNAEDVLKPQIIWEICFVTQFRLATNIYCWKKSLNHRENCFAKEDQDSCALQFNMAANRCEFSAYNPKW